MEWTVLDWNTPSIKFYRKLGAKLRKQWIRTDLEGAPLSRLARRRPTR
jgi:RimJ/RimL family protein N-acetyltransferase